MEKRTAILLIQCPDRQGLVAAVTDFLLRQGGNVVDLDEHVDREAGVFFMRVEWEPGASGASGNDIGTVFEAEVARLYGMRWSLHFSDATPRMAVFVSRLPHCLYDILSRCDSGEWRVEIPLIFSNHPDLDPVARRFEKPFRVFDVNPSTKAACETAMGTLIDSERIDFIVLARYMQTLSPEFVARYAGRIINIHHSFLPAFPGARPYHSAHARGVKIIGATSHYVTEELDGGPIIDQDVARVSHHDRVEDLVRKGRDLEKTVLARAIWSHLQRKVLVHGNRTVVFA